jgi:aspartyl-tRNA(Asn)/glutamyl-tRNA(Gln) amidotransferase subunit A
VTPLHRRSLHDLSADIAAGRLTSVALTEALIERIGQLNPTLRAFATTTFALARRMARRADADMAAGRRRGPLHGIPVALKDAYDTRAIPTTVCSRLLADRVPAQDAVAWRRLRAAGAVLLGKLECTELCLGGPEDGGLFPHAVNPWNPARSAGGSSSGAAVALAAGMVPAALGSDTAGSIRLPAAFCGVAGFKPSAGLVSRRGLYPLAPSLDEAGPMARNARDCALLLDALAGYDRSDAASRRLPAPRAAAALAGAGRLDGLCIGHVRTFTEAEAVGPEPRRACEAALTVLARLGATIREVTLPDIRDFTACAQVLMTAEAFAHHARDFRDRADLVTPQTRGRITLGAFLSAEDYLRAQDMRRELAAAIRATMEGLDALVYPCVTGDAPLLSEQTVFGYLDRPLMTTPANLSGAPAISVRAGLSAAGLPLSVQITGRHAGDATVLAIAHAFERGTPDLDLWPPGF